MFLRAASQDAWKGRLIKVAITERDRPRSCSASSYPTVDRIGLYVCPVFKAGRMIELRRERSEAKAGNIELPREGRRGWW